ncbi:MAG: bifunctional UDP-N-acetylglucosamine diphosphorylase/glucosamine-1-phosphate N-acetyltransferase GlmU [Rickettsiales bacterium]|nr:bifunctional UDP-N-acetylglucosamine diphosphorylase/glucosamine-1-phosphate N-acetyltransferase GlmU [Rickettsiales bacterium]
MLNNYKNICLILGAGKGTRMKNDTPKILHSIAGKKLIEYSYLTANLLNAEVITIISELSDEISPILNKYQSKNVIQAERLGTGHAVKLCLDLIHPNNNVIILYGDTPFIKVETINNMLSEISDNTAICILGFEASNPSGYGRLISTSNNKVLEIIEEKEANLEQKKISLCNSGIMVFNGKYINEIISKIDNQNSKGEYYLTDAVKIANNLGLDVKYISTNESEVIGINSQQERAEAEKIYQNQLRDKHLSNGVIITDPQNVYFSDETEIASGVIIDPFVVFKGKVKIGKNSVINSFSHLEDCEIAENVNIGPYARIRPKTKIYDDAKIGNFVELKNAKIGKGSKVNHLSYIGDANIGKNVNIGAGTITCNYDGKNKFTTEIADNVFVGSNSSLIAPINIAENAIIGAGTTLFADAPANKITINKKEIRVLDKKL